jgi:hypothetical protein
MLKIQPWFLYSTSEEDAMQLCEKYGDNVSGVVVGKSFIVKHPEKRMTLQQREIKQITHQERIDEIEPANKNECDDMEMIASLEEIDEEFNKLQLGID